FKYPPLLFNYIELLGIESAEINPE
ncbi:MAG: hypothetical protein ACD_9C00157G0005, partial [uncultured bacterium]